MEAGYGHSHHTGAVVSNPPISRPQFLSFPGPEGGGVWPEGSTRGGGLSPGCGCRLCPLCRLARHTCAGCVECQVTTWSAWSVGIPRRPPRQGAAGVWRKVGASHVRCGRLRTIAYTRTKIIDGASWGSPIACSPGGHLERLGESWGGLGTCGAPRASVWGDESALEPDRGDGCPAL